MTKLVLRPYQQVWIDRIINDIYPRYPCVVDTTRTGKGKTAVAIALGLEYKCPLFLVGPVTLRGQWETSCKKWGVELIDYVSYQTLRGVKTKPLAHEWLTREDVRTKTGKKKTKYFPTQKLLTLVEEGALFVFDEWQNVANLTDQYRATAAVAAAAIESSNSLVSILSATPMTKEKQFMQMLKFTRIIKTTKLFTTHIEGKKRVNQLAGAQALVDFCTSFNETATETIMAKYPVINRKQTGKMVNELFTTVVKESIIGGMVDDEVRDTKLSCYNMYCDVNPNTIKVLKPAITAMEQASRMYMDNQSLEAIDRRHGAIALFSTIGSALKQVHKHMSELFVFRALDMLADPQRKVVMFLKYKCSIKLIQCALEDMYPVLTLTGKLSEKKRNENLQLFTSDDMDYRILLCQIKVGGTGTNIQSTVEGMIIDGLCVADWSLPDIEQASGRVYRAPYINNASFSVLYPRGPGMAMNKIINNLVKSSATLRSCIDSMVAQGKVLPVDYPNVDEDLNPIEIPVEPVDESNHTIIPEVSGPIGTVGIRSTGVVTQPNQIGLSSNPFGSSSSNDYSHLVDVMSGPPVEEFDFTSHDFSYLHK